MYLDPLGYMNSLEWNGGMERWNGLLDWSTGAVAFTLFTLTGGLTTPTAIIELAAFNFGDTDVLKKSAWCGQPLNGHIRLVLKGATA